jgi:hypothetical protein
MEIKEMVMRIPGVSKQEAGLIAQEVSRALAQQSWRWPAGARLDALHLKIDQPSERSRDALVAAIVRSIAQAVQSPGNAAMPA